MTLLSPNHHYNHICSPSNNSYKNPRCNQAAQIKSLYYTLLSNFTMCYRVFMTYRCNCAYTVLLPYSDSRSGHPKCFKIQSGKTVPGHWDTEDAKEPTFNIKHYCVKCCFRFNLGMWEGEERRMKEEYERTLSLWDSRITEWLKDI